MDSLFGQVHSKHAEEVSFMHKCGPKYIDAANIIRDRTLQWAGRMEYLNKPLPAITDSKDKKQDENHGMTATIAANTCSHGFGFLVLIERPPVKPKAHLHAHRQVSPGATATEEWTHQVWI
ncbi:hypothetical protein VP1G_10790 [Cytospora mali]|uniref:Uncharacterized protein n=1 Tax=Cytospora mali TaxID=578113 RepID=A0A194UWI5_CYTMA|nr:hypothetical protein VP1G_10790 [Valsa mali var. pyri (nom. inval.)]